MHRFTLAALATFTTAAAAHAGGLDRSGQDITALFEPGNYAELNFGFVDPSLDGTDTTPSPFNPGGDNDIDNVADNFLVAGAAFKYQFTEAVSFAVIVDEPYGSDIEYPGDPATTALGGTEAVVDSSAVTALARYRFGNGFSVHGGVRYEKISADVTLGGLAYGGINGYNAEFSSDGAFGYVIGGAYERPDIALRVAVTYSSEIDHDLKTVETVNGVPVGLLTGGLFTSSEDTSITAPESVNVDFQTGVAPGTLIFGSIRYAHYSKTIVSPTFFDLAVNSGPQVAPGTNAPTDGDSLTQIENSYDLEIGIGRQFTDRFAGSISVGYSTKGEDYLVSPLAPRNGSKSIALGGTYQVTEAVKLTGGIRYTAFGEARPETGTPDTQRAVFDDNDAVSVGLKVGYTF